jgi:hypothetical protein
LTTRSEADGLVTGAVELGVDGCEADEATDVLVLELG